MKDEDIERLISAMNKELELNEELFKNVPPERLARITSLLFSTTMRLGRVLPAEIYAIVIGGILSDANDLVKAYNNDKQLKVAIT